ncbi:MAG: protein kinase [Acidobacteria bacterium]|nr:protein kinase [Acidobacteriota bacterium]MBV9477120.1 protein kinase [Acidobacteriota bacterium]
MSESSVLANGRFSVQRRIGAGGMGVVYEAYDRDRQQTVALKKLLGTDATAIYRIKNEFRALADVVHPNLVRLYELIGEGEDWFFTMEIVDGVDFLHYVRGRTVASIDDATTEKSTLVDSRGAAAFLERAAELATPDTPTPDTTSAQKPVVDYDALRRTLKQLAEGVAALHAAGKLHRDIKPSNVLVTRAERVVILDFGLATDVSAFQGKLTFGGTPAYMAPEQIAEMPANEASDCYAIGVILYEALTGTLPFSGNFYSMLMQKRTTDPRPPIDVVASIPDDLNRICTELLRRDPEKRLSARDLAERATEKQARAFASAPTLSRPRETPFVGRLAQLDDLESALAATERGTPVTVMVRGASGMGKTALVRHFLHDVQRRDPSTVVFNGRCYEQESVPYKAVDSLIDDLVRYLKRLTPLEARALMPTDVAALARLFPVLQELEPVVRARKRAVEIRDAQELRRRAFAALRELMARMADEHRVILFLDDVQWGDRDSAALLAEVLRPPDAPPLLVIACHRTEEMDGSPLLAEMQRLREQDNALGDVRDVVLEELTRAEARDLARALSYEQGGTDRVEAIAREAGGSPYFIVELARYADSTGLTTNDYGAGDMVLDSVIRSRIALLPAVARDLLEVVAVAGRPILASAANVAAGLRGDDEAMLARLRADHLLRTRVRARRDEVDTYHDRIREAILAAVTPERRRARHRTLAETLESMGARDPELLAVHYRGAGDDARAAEFARDAGDRAAAALAFENAAHFFAMALDLESRGKRISGALTEGSRAILMKLADALANAGRGADAAPYYLRAAEAADATLALELQRRASESLLRGGHVDEGLRVIRTVLQSAELTLPATPRRAILGFLLGRLRLLLRGLRVRERSAQEVPQELLTRIDVCWAMVTGLARIDNVRSAFFQPIHLRCALQSGEPYRVARALAAEACFSATRGDTAKRRTERIVTRAERSARSIGEPHAIGMSMMARSLESFYLGMFRDAHQKAEEAETIFRERCTGVSWEINTTVNYSLCSLMYMGELQQLAQRIPVRLREAEEHGDLYAGIDPVCRPGIMWLAQDDPDAARRAVRQVMDRWSLQGFHFQHYLEMYAENQIDLYEGRWASAWRRADERWPLMKASFLLRIPFVKIEGLHLKARCALAAAIGSGDRALLDVAERDAAAIEKAKSKWALPFAHAIRAGVAAQRGSTNDAAEFLAVASRGFEKAEMMLYAKAAAHRRATLTHDRNALAVSESWMRVQGVRNPARLLDVLLPGFN